MTPRPPRRRAGDALRFAAPDLARIWRAARTAARTAVFPGLLDGVAESFLAAVGEAYGADRDPALIWPAVEGIVRLDGRDRVRGAAETEAEWDFMAEVLRAACRALAADDPTLEWMSRAVVIARTGCRSLPAGAPPGVVTVRVLSPPPTRPGARARGPR